MHDLVAFPAGWDMAGPADQTWGAQVALATGEIRALPVARGAGQLVTLGPGGALADIAASALPSATVPEPATDIIAELGRLSRLHESGALSPEEFLAAKGHVLGV